MIQHIAVFKPEQAQQGLSDRNAGLGGLTIQKRSRIHALCPLPGSIILMKPFKNAKSGSGIKKPRQEIFLNLAEAVELFSGFAAFTEIFSPATNPSMDSTTTTHQ
jgi:hypothetical protein